MKFHHFFIKTPKITVTIWLFSIRTPATASWISNFCETSAWNNTPEQILTRHEYTIVGYQETSLDYSSIDDPLNACLILMVFELNTKWVSLWRDGDNIPARCNKICPLCVQSCFDIVKLDVDAYGYRVPQRDYTYIRVVRYHRWR